MKTAEICGNLVQGTIEAMGYVLRDVEFVKEHGGWVLTLYIDKDGGVTLDDCEAVSRAVDPVLDEHDPIAQAYSLSVSSPGLDRPLRKSVDFARCLGREVAVKLYAPLNKKKEWIGVLTEFNDVSLSIQLADGTVYTIEKKDAALVKPHIKF